MQVTWPPAPYWYLEHGRITDAKYGLTFTEIQTGDNQITAQVVATTLGIDDVHADVLPDDKQRIVKGLRASGKPSQWRETASMMHQHSSRRMWESLWEPARRSRSRVPA